MSLSVGHVGYIILHETQQFDKKSGNDFNNIILKHQEMEQHEDELNVRILHGLS